MNLVVTILIGVCIGVAAELVLPRHTTSELLLAVVLGVAGALVARYVGEKAGWYGTEEPKCLLASVAGAILVVVLYGVCFRKFTRLKR
jgi:uncharacterized membrane protein YeaQ/YmgE (transglycosylase-associated protein family)